MPASTRGRRVGISAWDGPQPQKTPPMTAKTTKTAPKKAKAKTPAPAKPATKTTKPTKAAKISLPTT